MVTNDRPILTLPGAAITIEHGVVGHYLSVGPKSRTLCIVECSWQYLISFLLLLYRSDYLGFALSNLEASDVWKFLNVSFRVSVRLAFYYGLFLLYKNLYIYLHTPL